MNVTRIVALGAAAGVLAALVAGATTSGGRRVEPAPVRPAAIEERGAALAAEVERLHERLRPTAALQQPSRNLFEFAAVRAPRPVTAAPLSGGPALTESATVPAASRPSIKLIGIAEDPGSDGIPVRTAVISGFGQLFLVKEGDAVTGRYRVARISGEVAELADNDDGSALRLALK